MRVLAGEEERRWHGGRKAGGFREAKSNKSYKITLRWRRRLSRDQGLPSIDNILGAPLDSSEWISLTQRRKQNEFVKRGVRGMVVRTRR